MFQEWEEFTNSCLAEVDIYKDLINRANDIYYSRVEKLLDSIANVEVKPYTQIVAYIGLPTSQLFELPTSEPWTMER